MNMKRLIPFMKHALLVVVVLSTLFISSCDKDDDGPTVFNGSIIGLINDTQFKQSASVSADVALDSLAKYLSIYPDLTALLSSSTEYTLFAPSNTAFVSLLATPGFPPKISMIDPDIIKGVLAYHIVTGKQFKSSLTSGASFTTLYPLSTADDKIIINTDGTLKTGSSNVAIEIVAADKRATNGVVHVVKSVMIPQSVGATLTPILGTMAGSILLGADFSYLADLVAKADNGFTETSTDKKISTLLANPTANATFFAPPNAVITAAAGGAANVPTFISGFTQSAARSVLLNHFVAGKYVVVATAGASQFTDAQALSAYSTKSLTMSVTTPSTQNPYGVAVTFTATGGSTTTVAPIVVKDIVVNNGVIQAIGGVIQ
jgi:uncharacterized surface protein with fasciclin (FAS1) repeats